MAADIQLASVDEALEEVRQGRLVVVLDHPGAQLWGGLVLAAHHVDARAIKRIAAAGSGMWYLCLADERCGRLGLSRLGTSPGQGSWDGQLTMPLSHRSAAQETFAGRALTVRAAGDPSIPASEFVRPGAVHPLRARAGGVVERAGLTEAAVDLARLAELPPAAVISGLVGADGTVARGADIAAYIAKEGLKAVAISALVRHRYSTERLLIREAIVRLPTAFGEFTAVAFMERMRGRVQIAIVKGDVGGAAAVPVYVRRRCLLGDVFRASTCECGLGLHRALTFIEQEGYGIVIYSTDERAGWPCGEVHDPDGWAWNWSLACQILAELDVPSVRVLHGPDDAKLKGVFGVRVVGAVRLPDGRTEARA